MRKVERMFIGHSLASGPGQEWVAGAIRWLLMGIVIVFFLAVGQVPTAEPIYGCSSIGSLGSIRSTVTLPTEVESQISFTGRSSPNALIGVLFKGDLIDIGVAGRTGEFQLNILSNDTMAPALFSALTEEALAYEPPTFILFAQDTLRLQSARVALQPTQTSDSAVETDPLVMPPTLKVFTPSVSTDAALILAGSGVPATYIVVVVDGEEIGAVVQTGLDGFWTLWLPGVWEVGDHSVHVLNRGLRGSVSQPSTPGWFEVVD